LLLLRYHYPSAKDFKKAYRTPVCPAPPCSALELGSHQGSPQAPATEPSSSSRPKRATAETEKGALYRQERKLVKQKAEAKKQRRAAAAADRLIVVPRKSHIAFAAGVRHSEDVVMIPNTFEEAMQSPQAQQWNEACNAEYQCLIDNTTWKLMSLPSGASLVKGKWVFDIKKDVDSNPVRFKARWVARGFTQKQGVDYDDTYASVTKPSTVRVLLSIVAAYDMECKQFDAITAFLNSTISEHKIYVEQPHGYEQQLNGQGAVCLLLKALYGLKQSPLLWYQELTKFLSSVHFTPIWSDACLFHHRQNNIFLLIYVNDFLIAGNLEGIAAAAALLGNKFKLKALGDVHYYLGCRIVRNRPNRKIYLLQDGYIKRVGDRFKQQLMNHHHIETPVDLRFRFKTQDEQANKHNISLYQQLISSLMWLAQMSRPEIIFAVHQLSKYLINPSAGHIAQAVRTLAYIVQRPYDGIVLGAADNNNNYLKLKLVGYSDASFGDDIDTRRSTCGYIFTLGLGPVSFKSGLQSIVAQSTTEAEYIAMTLAAKEAAALTRLLNELGIGDTTPVTIYEDSQPAIDLLKRTAADGRTKHIDIRWHYIRQEVDLGHITVKKISTHEQVADGLTKTLDKVKFEQFKQQLGVVDCTNVIKRN